VAEYNTAAGVRAVNASNQNQRTERTVVFQRNVKIENRTSIPKCRKSTAAARRHAVYAATAPRHVTSYQFISYRRHSIEELRHLPCSLLTVVPTAPGEDTQRWAAQPRVHRQWHNSLAEKYWE
jgi:hypothetical protein